MTLFNPFVKTTLRTFFSQVVQHTNTNKQKDNLMYKIFHDHVRFRKKLYYLKDNLS